MYQYVLDDVLAKDEFLRTDQAKAVLATAILFTHYSVGDTFPHHSIGDKVLHLQRRVKRCISSIKGGGYGLKTRVAVKNGEVAGIYGGPVVP